MRSLLAAANVCTVVCFLTVACENSSGPFPFPTPQPVGSPAPNPSPAPVPRPFAPFEFTRITVGEVVNRRVAANPPPCVGLPGWPCQYFRLTAQNDGRLVVELKFKAETQAGQGVDITVNDPFGREVWADHFERGVTRVSLSVTGDTEYQITLWYTFVDLEIELRSSLE